MGIGFKELIVILIIVIVLFGAKRIPQIMRDMGKGIKGFKEGLNEEDNKDKKDDAGN